MHIKCLHDLFPWFEYHLYDSRPFSKLLDNIPKIHLHNKYFDDQEIQKYIEIKDRIFFISDIRSLSYNAESREYQTLINNENAAYNDMKLQMDWVLSLKPYKSMLKGRFPYKNSYTKEIHPNLTIKYLSGICWLQPWRGITSTEVRLIPNDNLEIQDWNFEKIENLLFHQNKVRDTQKFLDPFNENPEPLFPDIGIISDWDSMFTIQVSIDYLQKFNILPNLQNTKVLLKFICENANPPHSLYSNRINSCIGGNTEQADE